MESTVTTLRFEQIYRHLVINDIKRQLNFASVDDGLPEVDVAYALSVASRLALAAGGESLDAAEAAKKAYNVAIRTVSLGNGAGSIFREASTIILSRIGNFPALQLLNERFSTEVSAFSALEILAREFENRAVSGDRSVVLTDFQVRLLKSLETKKWVSVSAPTSAGKSFTLELEIGRQLRGLRNYRVVYLVPTRALMRQVIQDLVQIVRGTEFQNIPILSAPSPPSDLDSASKIIYVLTQERFANLLAAGGVELGLDALIIDEAQEITEQNRGQILEAVIGKALTLFPTLKVFFSSPLKSNPEYLLNLFTKETDSESFIEHVTPVSQNIINVYSIKGRGNTSQARFELWLEGETLGLGTKDLSFQFRKPYLHKFAINFTGSEETSIIYCNEPRSADKTAAELAQEINTPELIESSISELASFLREHVHSQYRLADLLEKRVAFHYGNIPQLIRGKIEELLKSRVLRFVCCTSTLLQGMNLPAKNIFVENPKKGRGRPMQSGDFWNLVGRAGRMAKEFDGNVYCIHGGEWESDPLKGSKLDAIKSAFSAALNDHLADLVEVALKPPASSESDQSWAEQALARIYGQFTIKEKRIAESEFANPANRAALEAVDESMETLKKSQTLPIPLLEENLYFHPVRLEEIANRFRAGDARDWIPPSPHARGSYGRLKSCFQLLEEVFFRTGYQVYTYEAFLALDWMRGATLKELIRNKIEYKNAGQDIDKINDLIRELFEDIESRLRYKYVKYMKVYIDVLRAVLIERNQDADAERIPSIHLFLEYGASSVTLINLVALGLSRTSAILLKQFRSMRDDLSLSACQQAIERVDITSVQLPAICRVEILRLRRVA